MHHITSSKRKHSILMQKEWNRSFCAGREIGVVEFNRNFEIRAMDWKYNHSPKRTQSHSIFELTRSDGFFIARFSTIQYVISLFYFVFDIKEKQNLCESTQHICYSTVHVPMFSYVLLTINWQVILYSTDHHLYHYLSIHVLKWSAIFITCKWI